jgi:hypothetical protein
VDTTQLIFREEKNAADYRPWRYVMRSSTSLHLSFQGSLRVNKNDEKFHFFSDMQIWVADTRRVIFDDLVDEVEYYMPVHLQQREAKRDLQEISQRQREKISE